MKKRIFTSFVFITILLTFTAFGLSASAEQNSALVIGNNDIKVSAGREIEVTFTADTSATYTLSLAEGENNAWVVILTDFGSEDIYLPYDFKLKVGQSKTFVVSTVSGMKDTINLVLSSDVVVETPKTECEINGHTWTDATCTTPKTCEFCFETEGAALGHNWVNRKCTECSAYDTGVYVGEDGRLCFFEWGGKILSGKIYVTENASNGLVKSGWYYTDANGRFYNNETAVINGQLHYFINGQGANGVREIDGELYCFDWLGRVRKNENGQRIYVTNASSNGIVKEGWYYTENTGRFYNEEIATVNGQLYYFVNGQGRNGVFEYEGNLYCADWTGLIRIGKIYITASSSNGIVKEGWYNTDGKGMIK